MTRIGYKPAMKILTMIISSSNSPAETESLAMPRASPPAESVPMALLNPLTNVAPATEKKFRSEISEIKQASNRFDVNRTSIIQKPFTRYTYRFWIC